MLTKPAAASHRASWWLYLPQSNITTSYIEPIVLLMFVFFVSDMAPVGVSKSQLSPSAPPSSRMPPPPPSSAAPLHPPPGGDTEDDEGMKHLQQVGTTGGTFHAAVKQKALVAPFNLNRNNTGLKEIKNTSKPHLKRRDLE